MAGIKIVDLPPLGRDLASTDLLELSLAGGTGSRKITGQEIMNASKLSINNTPIINGTVGRVLFQGTGDVLQQSSSLFWDNTNSRLGIGTETPTTQMQIVGSSNTSILTLTSGTRNADIAVYGSGSLFEIGTQASYSLSFKTNSTGRMIIYGGGNVGIGTTTDAGFKLDVVGNARIQGSTTTSTSLTISGGFVMTEASNVHTFTAPATNRTIRFITNSQSFSLFPTGNFAINNTTDDGFRLDVNGTARVSGNFTLRNVTDELLFANATVKIRRVSDKLSLEGFAGFDFIDTNTAFTRMQIRSTGNVLINTTTDAGFRLDVNGTVRSQGNLFFGTAGSYLLGDTNNIRLIDKNGQTILQSFPSGVNNSETYLRCANSTISFLRLRDDYMSLEWANSTISSTAQNPIQITRGYFGNVGATDKSVMYVKSTAFSNLSNATTLRGIFIDINDTTTYTGFTTVRAIEAPRGGAYFNTTSPQASSVLQADSTTQGFLPPRMTQAQRNAIASPAIGLEIYQTDATEGKYIYKSSGWTYIG